MRKSERKAVSVLAGLAILALMVPLVNYLVVVMPVDTQYNRDFASHVTMAKDQSTFEGMNAQVVIIMDNMQRVFAGHDYNAIFSTWWGPDQTYENSLQAQWDYLENLSTRLMGYAGEYKKMLEGNTTTFLQDWYHQSIENARREINREGGLDWVLFDAFRLNLHPGAYWSQYWIPAFWAIEVMTGIIVFRRMD
jgi:hypothetical protein